MASWSHLGAQGLNGVLQQTHLQRARTCQAQRGVGTLCVLCGKG